MSTINSEKFSCVRPVAMFAIGVACACTMPVDDEAITSVSRAAGPSSTSASITSPSDGDTVSGVVMFAATATSGSGVARVDFYVDGVMILRDTSAPYQVDWDTSTEADGVHTLRVEAKGNKGKAVTDQISVTVDNGVPPATYTVGGAVTGLTGAVTLRNNGTDDLIVSSDGGFTFATALADGSAYNVSVAAHPTDQTCAVASGSGAVAGADVTNVSVTCADSNPGDGVVVKLASFNIENFGTSKAGKPAVMTVLVDIALRYDVLFIQELSNVPDSPDNTGPVIRQYLDEINQASGNLYAMSVSPRVGGTQGEQYVIIYNIQKVSVLDSFLYNDAQNDFLREPYITHIQVGDEDLHISNVHTQPDSAQAEIYALTDVAHSLDGTDPDILLLGDFNADGSYFNESQDWPGFALLGEGYQNLIDDTWDTTVLTTDYTYDRIVASPTLLDNYHTTSPATFYFDDPAQGGWDMTPILTEGCAVGYLSCSATYQDAARRVSDHYPVEVTLQFGGTINDPPPPPPVSYATSFETDEPAFEKISGAGAFYPDTCPAGTAPQTGAAGISNSTITTSYSGRAIQSVDCLEVTASPIDASFWITASTSNGGNNVRGRVTYLWFTDAACSTAHATAQTSGTSAIAPEGSYIQITASESPPDAAATYFKIRTEVRDENTGANTGDDWCIDDVEVIQ